MFTDVSMCCDHIVRAPKYHHCVIYITPKYYFLANKSILDL